jgi:hypothetical protein
MFGFDNLETRKPASCCGTRELLLLSKQTPIRGQLDFECDRDPSPEVVLEIDLTSKLLDR